MSDTALLDGLNWSAPEVTETCTYEAAGWSCRSTGFLWFSETRDGGERLYPCPRCNTELFLAKSEQRFSAERDAAQCVCCGPGLATWLTRARSTRRDCKRTIGCTRGRRGMNATGRASFRLA